MAGRPFDLSRRAILKSSVWGTALAALPAFTSRDAEAASRSTSIAAVVDTTGGRLRGVVCNGVHVYRGIPYAASTAGANRFMPPRKSEPWTGIRDAFQNGHSSPQVAPSASAIGWGLRGSAQQAEDCLVLNVFSPGAVGPGVNIERKRPVMMWIHGGGYTYGSGSSLGYDGANLARTGDVVVVCINHRLNVVGHLYLEGAGPEFADSGNVGLLDIVASLAS
jgi:para-nitrobenzyl esterase